MYTSLNCMIMSEALECPATLEHWQIFIIMTDTTIIDRRMWWYFALRCDEMTERSRGVRKSASKATPQCEAFLAICSRSCVTIFAYDCLYFVCVWICSSVRAYFSTEYICAQLEKMLIFALDSICSFIDSANIDIVGLNLWRFHYKMRILIPVIFQHTTHQYWSKQNIHFNPSCCL